jgi:hypothetical protein
MLYEFLSENRDELITRCKAKVAKQARTAHVSYFAGAECASALGVVPPRGPSLRGGTPTTLGKSLAAVWVTGVGTGGTFPCLISPRR